MSELAWVAEARKHIGLAEVAGKQHNGTIVNWLLSWAHGGAMMKRLGVALLSHIVCANRVALCHSIGIGRVLMRATALA